MKFYLILKEILEKVNTSEDLSEGNIIDKIKNEIEIQLKREDLHKYTKESLYRSLNRCKAANFDLDYGFEIGHSLLHLAAELSLKELADVLIKKGLNVNAENCSEETPLYLAVLYGNVEIVELLLKKGADVDSGNKRDVYTPLHSAAINGRTQIVEKLLERGAKVDIQAKLFDQTPLHLAAEYDYIEIVKLLLKKGADVNIQDKHGMTPLNYALRNKHLELTKILLDHGADPTYIYKPKATKVGVAVGVITAIVTPLILAHTTALSTLAIIGATIASALIIGSIAYGVTYMASKHALSSKLSEVNCNEVKNLLQVSG